MTRILYITLALLISPALVACGEDQYNPQTWIDKLNDESGVRVRAVRQLAILEDPVAIPALVKAWETHGNSPTILQVIVDLARPIKESDLHPDEVKAGFAREEHWEAAKPALNQALIQLDGSEFATRNAEIAARAIAEGKIVGSIDALIAVIEKDFVQPQAKQIQLLAIQALGEYGDNEKAVSALLRIMQKEYEGKEQIFYAGNAVLALEKARPQSTKAVKALIETMYKHGALFNQVRRALIAIGKPAVAELESALRGPDGSYADLAKELKFHDGKCEPVREAGNATTGPGTNCTQPKQLEYKAAVMLGDLYAESAIPLLVKELKEPALPAYYSGSNPQTASPGPMQHQAVLEALRKISAPRTADAVAEYMKATDDANLKAQAIEVYSYVATDKSNMETLEAWMTSSDEDPSVRVAAGRAFSRIGDNSTDLEKVAGLAKKYREEANKYEKIATPLIDEFDQAKKAFDDYEVKWGKEDMRYQKLEETLEKLKESRKHITDEAAKAEQDELIKQAQAEVDKLKPEYDERRKQREELRVKTEKLMEKKSDPERKMMSFRSSQITAELNVVRIRVGMKYGNSATDLAKVLNMTEDEVYKFVESDIRAEDWKDDKDRQSLYYAAVERAMISLAKMGSSGQSAVDILIGPIGKEDTQNEVHLRSNKPMVRESVLHALVHVAPKPCEKCVKAMDRVIDEQKDNTTLNRLIVETKAVRSKLAQGMK